jgi:hypothetical protein
MPRDETPAEPQPQRPDAPPEPQSEPTPDQVEGVRRQREHIRALDGEDPLRGGVAD